MSRPAAFHCPARRAWCPRPERTSLLTDSVRPPASMRRAAARTWACGSCPWASPTAVPGPALPPATEAGCHTSCAIAGAAWGCRCLAAWACRRVSAHSAPKILCDELPCRFSPSPAETMDQPWGCGHRDRSASRRPASDLRPTDGTKRPARISGSAKTVAAEPPPQINRQGIPKAKPFAPRPPPRRLSRRPASAGRGASRSGCVFRWGTSPGTGIELGKSLGQEISTRGTRAGVAW
jgi:hypothetical protein